MFEPGDKIVCISDRSPCCQTQGDKAVCPQPVVGRYYTVASSADGQCNKCGTVVPCLATVEVPLDGKAWPQVCFRKVERGDADLFSLAAKWKELEPAYGLARL